jgi:hypothetical protein
MTAPVQISRRHHYVPRFLLKSWLTIAGKGHSVLRGHYWDANTKKSKVLERGLDYFCQQTDLLTLGAHKDGVDIIERRFFKAIDDEGAAARVVLLKDGPQGLTMDQRRSFVRLLLSLEARRPSTLMKLRTEGVNYFSSGFDSDEEILSAFAHHGIKDTPSAYWERATGTSLTDRAVLQVQSLTDSAEVGSRILNARWGVRPIDPSVGRLVFSDRPLVRINPYNSPQAVWAIPLDPQHIFFATSSAATFANFMKASCPSSEHLAQIGSRLSGVSGSSWC